MRSSLIILFTASGMETETCKPVSGTAGLIKSTEFETTACPAWYQVWQGETECYPAKEFSWCWSLEPDPSCNQLQIKFNKFSIEEQSKALHNFHDFTGEDVCIDRVEIVTDFGYYLFCDESHQIAREATYMENMAFDPFLNGWFDWVSLNVTKIDVVFESKELGGAGSSNFAGFELEWRCTDEIDQSEKAKDSLDLGQLISEIDLSSDMIASRSLSSDEDKCDSCDPNASCVDSKCSCNDGFVGNGFVCISLEGRCHQKHQNQCDENAICLDTLGSDGFECKCKGNSTVKFTEREKNTLFSETFTLSSEGFTGDGFTCKQWMFGVTDKPKDEASNVWKDIHENSLERGGGFSFFDDKGEADFSGRRAECDEKCGENASCINKKCHCLDGFVGNGMFCISNDFGRIDQTTETPDTVIGMVFFLRSNFRRDTRDIRPENVAFDQRNSHLSFENQRQISRDQVETVKWPVLFKEIAMEALQLLSTSFFVSVNSEVRLNDRS